MLARWVKFKYVIVLFFFHFTLSFGKEMKEDLGNGNIFKFKMPDTWKGQRDYFGLNFLIYAPESAMPQRPVITILISGNNPQTKNQFLSAQDEPEYQSTKLAWIKKRSNSFIEFLPYKKQSIGRGTIKADVFGVKYRVGKISVTEKSYYFFCGKKIIFVKTLHKFPEKPELILEQEGILESLSCS